MSGSMGSRQERVVALLRSVAEGMTHLSHRMAEVAGVNTTDLQAIAVLQHHGRPLTVSELGRALELSSAAVSGLVDRLERSGHVARSRGEDDRRRVYVTATPGSREVALSVLGGVLGRLDHALADLDDRDLAGAELVLEAVLDALDPDGRIPR